MTDTQSAPMGEQELTRQLELQALRTAIPMLARRIERLYESRQECERQGQTVYVSNLTEQINTLEQDYKALCGLRDRAAASPRLAGSGDPVAWQYFVPTDRGGVWLTADDMPTNSELQSGKRKWRPLYAGVAPSESVGWQPIGSAPKDGTPVIGRKIDDSVVRVWWQPEFDAFISSCREMMMHNGYTFADGSTRELHSPVIETVTGWMPYPPEHPSQDRGAAE